MRIINDMTLTPGEGQHCKGNCANCNVEVYEAQWLLDDAYNVWLGRCPSCKALNFLSMNHGLRGYTSGRMWLVLPTEEEKIANGLPAETITSGASGKPATAHGSPAGELYHRLTTGKPLHD